MTNKNEIIKKGFHTLEAMDIDDLFDEYEVTSIELSKTKHDDPNFRRCIYYKEDIKFAINQNYKRQYKKQEEY